MSCKRSQRKSPITQNCVKKHSSTGEFIRLIETILKSQISYVKNLPQYLKDTITWYTMPHSYAQFNKYIREGKKLPVDYEYHKNNFDQIFKYVPPLKKSLNVYRGVKDRGHILNNQTYLSTTLVKTQTKNFSKNNCCIVNITLPAGSKIIPIFILSDIPNEAEILLDKDSTIVTTGKYVQNEITNYSVTFIPKVVVIDQNKEVVKLTKTLDINSNRLEPKFDNPVVKNSSLLYNTLNTKTTVNALRRTFNNYINKQPLVIHKKQGLRIVSYNIHNGFTSVNGSKINYEKILKLLKDIDADIICLQEVTWNEKVDKEMLENDMKELGYSYKQSIKASDIYNNGFYGNYTFSKFEIIKKKRLNLGKDEEMDEGRAAGITTIKLGKKKISIVNTHLDVYDETGKLREKQINKILKEVKSYRHPVVVTGDFNTTRVKDYSKFYLKWILANQSSMLRPLPLESLDKFDNAEFNDITDVVEKRISITSWTGRRIDYMFVNKYINVYKAFTVSINYSDHLPLVGDIKI